MERLDFVGGRGHETLEQLYNLNKAEVTTFFKWTFIRNPFDRIASAYHYFHGQTETQREIMKFRKLENGFSQFLRNITTFIPTSQHLRTIENFLKCSNPDVKMDFIGRFENLESDWSNLLSILNIPQFQLPKSNESKFKPLDKTYIELYNEEDKAIIKGVYGEELNTYYPQLLSL